jgi:hypothetical protein
MQELLQSERDKKRNGETLLEGVVDFDSEDDEDDEDPISSPAHAFKTLAPHSPAWLEFKAELLEIRDMLAPSH